MRRDGLLIGLLSLAVVAVLMASGFAGATSSKNSSAQRAMAGLTVNLDQYANQAGQGWQNGDLNGNNSSYAEGNVVPFRYDITGLGSGAHSVHINYDFTASGHEAYDFLATYNDTVPLTGVDLCASGGGAAPATLCSGNPATVGSPTAQFAFPSDPFAVPGANNLTVAGAQTAFGGDRTLLCWGCTSITGITVPSHSGDT